MRRLGLAVWILSSAGVGLAPAATPVPVERAAATISAGSAFETVERLSRPDLDGRLTGTPGYAAAARWIAGELKAARLRPLPEYPDFMQRFPVTVTGIEGATLEVLPAEEKGQTQRLEYFKQFLPLFFSGTGDVTAEVVFVGYGITAPSMARDDYAGVDVRGKVVMAVRGAPRDGRDWKEFDSHRARTANAKAHGAAGYLFAESAAANPNGAPIPDLPMADVTEEVANSLLDSSKLALEELRRVLEKGGLASFATGRTVHLAVKARPAVESEGANVVATLGGSDPKRAGEYVLVGAHLDHCGSWPALMPGADDNASGSATVLEIARAAARLRPPPPRSLVFVFFGGEEEGLLGSKFLVEHAPKSLGRCVAVFNLDMEGAGRGAFVAGGKNFPDLFRLLEEARDALEPGLTLRAGLSRGEPRADHGPFQAAGIPAVSLFGTGASPHHGYHTDEDTVWWIAPKNMEAVGRIVLAAAARAAGAP